MSRWQAGRQWKYARSSEGGGERPGVGGIGEDGEDKATGVQVVESVLLSLYGLNSVF